MCFALLRFIYLFSQIHKAHHALATQISCQGCSAFPTVWNVNIQVKYLCLTHFYSSLKIEICYCNCLHQVSL